MPADYAEFERYWNHMIDDVLVAHPTATYGVGYVTKGLPRPKSVNPWVWRLVSPVFNPLAAFPTTGGMPPRTREVWACRGASAKSATTSASPRSAGRDP